MRFSENENDSNGCKIYQDEKFKQFKTERL